MAGHPNTYLQIAPDLVLTSLERFAQYDSTTGTFIRTARTKGPHLNQIIGQPVGSNKSGYLRVELLGHKWYISRLIWAKEFGDWPQGEIDHIDGNTLNNHVDNLRVVNSVGNGQNKKLYKNNTTGYIGVKFDTRIGRYAAQVTINKKRYHVGYYDSPEEAADGRTLFLANKNVSFAPRHGEVS